MFRTLLLSAAALSLSSAAFAHPEPEAQAVKTDTVKAQPFTKPQLPSQADIQDALKQMPNMNAIMGDMMGLMQDEKFKNNMEKSAKVFSEKMDKEDVFKAGPDGMPDFNKAFASMLGAFSDEEAMGGMVDTLMELAETMEKHIPEGSKTAVPKP